MNKAFSILALSLTLSVSVLSFSGCSKSSTGSGDGTGISDSDLALQEQNRFGDGSIPNATEGGVFQDVQFDYDSSVVRSEFHEIIRKNASILSADASLHSEVEGHCDRRGTNEYNLALGEERAKAVAALMVSYGARPDQLSTISYGEEIPLDPADNDAAYAKNRRAHFALYRKKDGR